MLYPYTTKVLQEMVSNANKRLSLVTTPKTRQTIINTSLKLFEMEIKEFNDAGLRMYCEILNGLEVSLMREEYILLLEGHQAVREIKPMMLVDMSKGDAIPDKKWPAYEAYKSALQPEKKNYGRCLVCRSCHHQNPETAFDCCNCGSNLHE